MFLSLLHTVGLCFATSTAIPCSSLDGPYCMYVNNKMPPVLPKIRDASLVMQHMPTKSREQKFSEALNTLSGIFKPLERKLTEAIRGRNKYITHNKHRNVCRETTQLQTLPLSDCYNCKCCFVFHSCAEILCCPAINTGRPREVSTSMGLSKYPMAAIQCSSNQRKFVLFIYNCV